MALTIHIEYKTWKKNSPFLYDMILRYEPSYPLRTHVESPSV